MKKHNKVKIVLLMLAMVFTLAAAAQVESKRPQGQKQDDPAGRIKAQLEKLNQQMIEAAINQDIKASMAFYTDDAISLPNYGKMLRGKNAIRKDMEEKQKGGMKMTAMNVTILEVTKLGNDILEIGTYKVTVVSPQMPKPVSEEGKYVTIWEKKEKGDMRIKLEIWNSDEHPMVMMEKMMPEKSPASPDPSQIEKQEKP